jgi:hemoglobin-like flavoprotein
MSTQEFLNPQQKQQLQKALRESDDPDLRERCLILLLLNERRTPREITELLGCAYRTIAYWQLQGIPNNLEILYSQKPEKPENSKDQPEPRNVRNALEEFIPLSEIKILEDTFARVKPKSTEFASCFYQNLFTDYPQVQPLFAYVQMEVQEKKLIMALVLIINNLRKLTYLKNILRDLGERHIRYGIVQEHYPMVGAALMKTLESFLGQDWTPGVKQAWIHGYDMVANLMLDAHHQDSTALK